MKKIAAKCATALLAGYLNITLGQSAPGGVEMTTGDLCKLIALLGRLEMPEATAKSWEALKSRLDTETYEAIRAGKIGVGMPEELLGCALGESKDVNETVASFGVHRQYVYGNGVFVYTENGKVTSYQH